MRNLVLSGGGIKGLLHLGALKSFRRKTTSKKYRKLWRFISRVTCSSIIMYWIYL